MFGPLGATEIVFILVLALLIFGPRRLPEVGRTVGKALGELRRATTDLKRSVNAELALEEERPLPRRPAPLAGVGETAAAGTLAAVRPAAGARPRAAAGAPAEPGISDEELLAANPELVAGGAAATGVVAVGEAERRDAAGEGEAVELSAEAPAAHPEPSPADPALPAPPDPAADRPDRYDRSG